MIKINKVILVSIFTIVVSCKKEETGQSIISNKTELIKVNPVKREDLKPRIIASKDIEYIPLETTDISMIGSVDKVQVIDGNYFITDKHNAKGIYIFDKDGHFLNKISPLGNGPHEVISMKDIQYNKVTKHIEIFDVQSKKILVYDLNGEFIKEFKTKVILVSFYPIKENEHYYYTSFTPNKGTLDTNKNYRLLRMDENDNLLSSFFNYTDRQADQKIVELQNNFFPIDNSDKVFFLESYCNNIYQLKGDAVILKYKLDFTNANIPDDLMDSDEGNKMGFAKTDYLMKNNAASVQNILFEDNEELVFHYVYDNLFRELHYDKKSKKYYEYSQYFVKNDSTGLSIDRYVTKKFSYSVIEPMDLLNGKINNYSARLQKILAHKKSTDNPIIAKIKR